MEFSIFFPGISLRASSILTKIGKVWSYKSAGMFEAHLPLLPPPVAFEESF